MNAYEVRLDVLKLAKDILELNKQKHDSQNTTTLHYSDEDVITSAKKLYGFISTKGDGTE